MSTKKEVVEALTGSAKWNRDQWGNFHPISKPDLRIKLLKVACRVERKVQTWCGPDWAKVVGEYFCNMEVRREGGQVSLWIKDQVLPL